MGTVRTTTIEASGTGPLTAGQLMEVLADFPADAAVTVRTEDSQREGQSWRVTSRSVDR